MKNAHTKEELRQRQALPLEAKVMMTENRIREWQLSSELGYKTGVVSFSGGKDSTVLLHIARNLYPDIPAVFSNTGLEYPEIQSFVKKHDNVKIVRPKMQFSEVISTYGYPLISKEVSSAIYYARRMAVSKSVAHFRRNRLSNKKNNCDKEDMQSVYNMSRYLPLARDIPVPISHYCCQVMKKAPLKAFQKKSGLHPILATMADESRIRTQAWLRTGCNAFEGASPKSQPMSFWTEQDVLQYIVENDIEIANVYGDIVSIDEQGNEYDPRFTLAEGCKLKCTGCQRTGCIFAHLGRTVIVEKRDSSDLPRPIPGNTNTAWAVVNG